MAEEIGTGLSGRATVIVEPDPDTEVFATVTITASGQVTGVFLEADGITPVADAQIDLLTASGVHAYATDRIRTGGFTLSAIPIGRFTVTGYNLVTGRLGSNQRRAVLRG